MKPRTRTGVVVTAVSVAVSFLTVCVPGVGAAHPGPSGAPAAGATGSWAYGALRSVSGHHQGLIYGWEASATFGFAVVLRELSSSSGNYTVDVNRTMGVIISVEYCKPDCSKPIAHATVSFHAWESLTAALDFTSAANVTVDGSLVPALGLSESRVGVSVGLTASAVAYLGGSVVGTRNLTVLLSGESGSSFAPALGLVPLTLTAGEVWNSTSNFTESGEANWSIVQDGSGLLAPTPIDLPGTVDLDRNGSVNVSGAYSGATVHLGGAVYDALNLSVSGPFSLREGFLLVPSSSNLFGASAPPWLSGSSASSAGSAAASQASVDVSSSVASGGHLGFAGSGVLWSSGTTNPDSVEVLPSDGPAAAAAPASGTNSTYLQGNPESVGQATTDQNCLATGLGCPSAGVPRGPLGALLVVGAAVVLGVVLLAVIVERRRPPAPSYPNAALYPPGASSAAPRGGSARPEEPPVPPADDDPLKHLW
jgi:hypothetical protein